MLNEPGSSPFDLRWRLLGIGVRVHPSFWIVMLLFGYFTLQGGPPRWQQNMAGYMALWAGCAFLSILVHELGHVLAARIFGESSDIVLYSMGGLAIGRFDRLRGWQRILVSAAGPAAGFLLLGLVVFAIPPLARTFDPVIFETHRWLFDALAFLFFMNLFWNLFNLVPIIPLDGGQIMREAVQAVAPQSGLRIAFGLSFLIAGSVAFYSGMVMYNPELPYPPLAPMFIAIYFAMFAMQNFTSMQAVAEHEKRSRYDERDW